MNVAIEKELRNQLGLMPPDQQQEVLDFARAVAARKIPVASGQALTRFAGAISPEDLALMAAAIEEGCKQVNTSMRLRV